MEPVSYDLAPSRNQLLIIDSDNSTVVGSIDTIAVSGTAGAANYTTYTRKQMHNELLANKTFNSETSRSSGLIPGQLRTDANGMISFLEEYYRLSNATGNPTNLINDFLREHDIDSVTETFFSGIQNLIAKNIPVSTIFDRQTLYKRIIDYYSLRGSAASVKAFFKIFYNENASIYYPKDDLFKPSDGQFVRSPIWRDARNYATAIVAPNDWINSDIADDTTSDTNYILSSIGNPTEADFLGSYSNTNSFPSEFRLKIQDSYYWQDYSYEIHSELSANIWQNDYLKLVHPAGLKYFYLIKPEAHTLNTWTGAIDYTTTWPYILPPNPGDHSPVSQPGDLNAANIRFRLPWNIISHDNTNAFTVSYNNLHITIVQINLTSSNQYNSNFYTLNQLNMNTTDYMNQLKFIDPSRIFAYLMHPIGPLLSDTTHSYSPINGSLYNNNFPPTAIGTYITKKPNAESPPEDEPS